MKFFILVECDSSEDLEKYCQINRSQRIAINGHEVTRWELYGPLLNKIVQDFSSLKVKKDQ